MALKAATKFVLSENIADSVFDAVIVVSHSWKAVEKHAGLKAILPVLENYSKINSSIDKCTVSFIPTDAVSSNRLFYSSTGTVNTDFDDVRRYQKAAQNAVKAAVSAGVKFPLLITIPYERFPRAELIAAVGALHSAYTPYHIRSEDNQTLKLEGLGIYPIADKSPRFLELIQGIERSFIVSRDIGDGDPQRMAPPKVAEYVQELFKGSSVKVTVDSDQEKIKKEYPLLAAVNRSANDVPEHQARIIWLEYSNEEESKNSQKEFETLMLVGKGVTLDTGGR
uniref:Cytosol aminopeptidase domain-containing protein n=1 Tax=Panagrolaimus superbus TaxID=310955 RepID=A0A914XTR8_9BILA